MSRKSIPGACPKCGKEALIIAGQIRDSTDWQTKHGIECELCEFKFTVDKKLTDDIFTLLKDQEKTT